MSNTIGDYIHYNYYNYLKQGLVRKTIYNTSNEKAKTAHVLYEEQKSILHKNLKNKKKSFSKKTLEKIEYNLNYIYGKPGNTKIYNIRDKMLEEMTEAIFKKVQQLSRVPKSVSMNNSLALGRSISDQADIDKLYKQLTKDEKETISKLNKNYIKLDNKSINYNTINQRIMNLINNIQPKAKGTYLFDEIDRVVTEWNNIRTQLTTKKINKTIHSNFLTDLNLLYKDLATQNFSYEKGLAGEIAVEAYSELSNLIDIHGKKYALGKITEIVNNTLLNKNNLKSHKGINTNLYDQRYIDFNIVLDSDNKTYKQKSMREWYNGEDTKYFTYTPTEDKIDIHIKVDGREIPVSIKNYNLSVPGNVSLLSGKSLIALIQEYTTFVNHYLNITTIRSGDDNTDRAPTKDLNTMKKAMKLTILTKAIAGGVYGIKGAGQPITKSGEAEILVVNDSSTTNPKFKVYHLQDIFEKTSQNMQLLEITNGSNSHTPLNLDFNNRYIKATKESKNRAIKTRISNIIKEMHDVELSVSINKNIFN